MKLDATVVFVVLAALPCACDREASSESSAASPSTTKTEAPAPATGDASKAKAAAAPAPAPTQTPAPVAPDPVPAPDAPATGTTPELDTLEATLDPIMAMTDEDAQNQAACKAAETIVTQMSAVERHPPAGVDASAWTEVNERMASGMSDFQIECAEDSAGNMKALTDALEVAKELHVMAGKAAAK